MGTSEGRDDEVLVGVAGVPDGARRADADDLSGQEWVKYVHDSDNGYWLVRFADGGDGGETAVAYQPPLYTAD